MSERPRRLLRGDMRAFRTIPTRWMDNDVYGHVNNVVYYSYFDTIVNAWLVDRGLLDPERSEVVGLVAETGCTFFASVAFPEVLDAGLAVTRLGTTSVRYAVAVFRADTDAAAAQGHFLHVYVERATGRPTPIPDPVRTALAELAG